MIYFDTNILIYFTIDQGDEKLQKSRDVIFEAIENETFFITPLVLSEYIFVLSKLKILEQHQDKIELFSQYISVSIDKNIVMEAYEICKKIDFCKNINDAIHLSIAQKHCSKLITFDSDFKKLEKFSSVEIEVLR